MQAIGSGSYPQIKPLKQIPISNYFKTFFCFAFDVCIPDFT
jgi:hypothetical protein